MFCLFQEDFLVYQLKKYFKYLTAQNLDSHKLNSTTGRKYIIQMFFFSNQTDVG